MSTVQDASSVSSLSSAGTTSTAKETEDRFLTLLVAQMKNQDPLDPLDNAEVTSQMAQLSTVQGIEDMNATLDALAASMGVNQMAQAANLIGSAVLVPGDSISPAELENVMGFDLSRPADKVTVDIFDATGGAVRSLDLGPREDGVNLMAWDGLTSSGTAAPDGAYTFRINATQGGEQVDSTALHLGLVNSVSQNSQGVQINLANSESVTYADIRQIF
ncbi:MAG TPA: flagellar hook assembly protein FlgD [Thiobacillus sp.]|jgi:flagellar basal-body rod modification protein FlgD|nr:flagellar hook assembly protein FlgD [Thiobacillus sp.]